MDNLILEFKKSTLANIEAIIKSKSGEEFAIEIVDLLLDYMWSHSEMLDLINETMLDRVEPCETQEFDLTEEFEKQIRYQNFEYERSV